MTSKNNQAGSSSNNQRNRLGAQGERMVAHYLQTHDYTIRAYNFRQRCGEIDLVAERGTTRTFVEVKMRSSHYFPLSQVVTASKQQKIIATARRYNHMHSAPEETNFRFDVALIEPDKQDTLQITYICNAFTWQEE